MYRLFLSITFLLSMDSYASPKEELDFSTKNMAETRLKTTKRLRKMLTHTIKTLPIEPSDIKILDHYIERKFSRAVVRQFIMYKLLKSKNYKWRVQTQEELLSELKNRYKISSLKRIEPSKVGNFLRAYIHRDLLEYKRYNNKNIYYILNFNLLLEIARKNVKDNKTVNKTPMFLQRKIIPEKSAKSQNAAEPCPYTLEVEFCEPFPPENLPPQQYIYPITSSSTTENNPVYREDVLTAPTVHSPFPSQMFNALTAYNRVENSGLFSTCIPSSHFYNLPQPFGSHSFIPSQPSPNTTFFHLPSQSNFHLQ